MGRPLNKRNFGATSGKIRIQAWVDGDSQNRAGYILKQESSNGYKVHTAGGESLCYLVDGTPAAEGEMSIKVFPYGSAEGSGATATALMGALTTTVTNDGTGGSYGPTTTLTLAGNGVGTQATYTVATAKVRAGTQQAAGTGYVTSDTITFSTGFDTPCILTVTASGGAITALAVTQAGVRSAAAATNPVAPDSTSGSGVDATVNLSYEILTLTLATPGSYSTLPSGAQATTHSGGGSGTGATLTVNTFQVVGGTVTGAGVDYQVATVGFSGGGGSGATATATVVDGEVTAIVATAGGTGYTSAPTIAISAGGSVTPEYANSLDTHLVKTFDDNVYVWKFQPLVITAGEANIDTID